MSAVILESELTCPHCGFAWRQTMPTDACQFYQECPACHTLLRPKPGDCCVFCSYGSVPCPPIQLQRMMDEVKGQGVADATEAPAAAAPAASPSAEPGEE